MSEVLEYGSEKIESIESINQTFKTDCVRLEYAFNIFSIHRSNRVKDGVR